MKYAAIVLCVFLVLSLCSWVAPDTVDLYSGTIVSGYLAGSDCQFYLDNYSGIALSDSGVMLSTDHSKQGMILVNGAEYEFTCSPGQSCKMLVGSAWLDFDIAPDQLPSPFPYPVYVGLFAVLLIFGILFFVIFSRGVF